MEGSAISENAAVIRCDPKLRNLAASLAVVVITQSVFIWSMLQGYLDTYWIMGAGAIGALCGYAALMLIAMPSARRGVELRDGKIRQLGSRGSIDLGSIVRIEYRPLTADIVISDSPESEVRVSLFARSARSLLSEILRAGGVAPSTGLDRSVGHVAIAIGFAGVAFSGVALLIKGGELPGYAWASMLAVPLIGVLVVYTVTTRRITREGAELVLASGIGRKAVTLGGEPSARFKVRTEGEFWPRVECFIRANGGQERRIPASGMNLIALASTLGCQPLVE